MKKFPKLIQSVLILTTSALMATPTNEIPNLPFHQISEKKFRLPDLQTLSYDAVVDLLALIESNSFEENCSLDDLDQINRFLSFLAMEGVTENEKAYMAHKTANLFQKNDLYYALHTDSPFGNVATHALYFQGQNETLHCRSFMKKMWDRTREFVSEHKTAIIIGTIVVVTVGVGIAVAVVVSAAAGASAAAGGLAIAGTATLENPELVYSQTQEIPTSESLTALLQDQITTFKETVAQEQFAAVTDPSGISIEDNGRIIGSLFAHKMVDTVSNNVTQNPFGINELKDLGFNTEYPSSNWLLPPLNTTSNSLHSSSDIAFSTDFGSLYGNQNSDLNLLSYQARGNLALESKYYNQAVQDFGHAIAINPSDPALYLERGIANFQLGDYEQSLEDYSQYVKKSEPLCITDFTIGFAKGVPRGVYDSGTGSLLFLSEFIVHPVHTSKQVVDSLTQLVILAKNEQFADIGEALSPELFQLITEWDNLPSETRGELAGYALGKLGTDLLAPGVVAKIASKSLTSAKELASFCKNMQIAQDTLILETASGIGIPTKLSEIVEMGKKTETLSEEFGFTAHEIGQLQKGGQLEATITHAYDHLTPAARESFEFFNKAQNFLKPFKGFMPESQARELIHQTGIKTFPRPQGIPENYRVKLTDKGAGMKYVHPTKEDTYIRVMPGKPHSQNSYQQRPYVSNQKDGRIYDNHGHEVGKGSQEGHIPYEEFIYRG